MIALLITIALFSPAGYATTALWPMRGPASAFETLAESFLRGVGIVGTLSFVLGTAGVPLTLTTSVTLFVFAMAAAAMVWRRHSAGPLRGAAYPRLASLLMFVPFVPVACDALLLPLADWDGLITWVPKARAIAAEGSIYGAFFFGGAGMNLHNHYPLLLPLDGAVLMQLCGSTDDGSVRWLYALIPAALLVMIRRHLAVISGAPAGAWVAAIAAWIPLVTHSAASAYSDLAVAAFIGAALLSLITPFPDRAAGDCAPWLAFLVLTKNEGILLCAAFLLAAAALKMLPTIRDWLLAAGAPAIVFLLLMVWRSIVPDAYDERYGVLLRDLPERLGHIPEAAGALLKHMLVPASWGFLWPVALLAFIVACRSPEKSIRRLTWTTGLFTGASLSGYIVIYAVTSWNISELARVTADRLLSHLLVPLCTLLAAGYASLATKGPAARSYKMSS